MDERSLVGGDDMRAMFQRGDDVLDRGIARFYIQRAGFKQNIGFCTFQPFADVLRGLDIRKMAADRGNRIQSVRIREPADPPGGHTGQSPADIVLAP